jgi:hypothetical protein
MPQSNHDPKATEAGQQVPARPHDSGSAANETVDGLDATTEALRRAAEIGLLVPRPTMLRTSRCLTGLV